MISTSFPDIQFIDINAYQRPCCLHLQNVLITKPRFFKQPSITFANTNMLSGLFRNQLGIRVMDNPHFDNIFRAKAHNITATMLAEGYLKHFRLHLQESAIDRKSRSLSPRPWMLVIASRLKAKCSRNSECRCPRLEKGRSFLNEIQVSNNLQSALPSAMVKRHKFGNNVSTDAIIGNKADVLIGLHGSNLYNMMFLSAGSLVIELLPKRFETKEYLATARFLNVHYISYKNSNLQRQCNRSTNDHSTHMTVSPNDVVRLMQSILQQDTSDVTHSLWIMVIMFEAVLAHAFWSYLWLFRVISIFDMMETHRLP